MNILASYPWIKEFLQTKATPEEFAREISLRGPAVERIHSLGDTFRDIVVGEILAVGPHPNADKLRVVSVNVGRKTPAQIVCGGSNLAVDQLVAVALPGARVRWHGEGDPVTLASAELRGVKSEGMICAANEIGLGNLFVQGEKEILDLSATGAKPGSSVAVAVGLEDPIFDIEATTNRPDAFAIVGLAREASASGLGKFTCTIPELPRAMGKPSLKIVVDEKKMCGRYMVAVVHNVKVGPSPNWMKARLSQAGVRSINNIVDITNYVMLELGQPMHAFDRAAVEGDTIRVRAAKDGEKLQALDGKEYELNPSHLVIANAKSPMAIAGVMGGELSGTTEKTVSVVFESAAFNAVSVRKTSRGLNLISDSSLRFEKGLSVEACEGALARALDLVAKIVPGAGVIELVDVRTSKYRPQAFSFRPEYAAALIGETIPDREMKKILESLGFEVSAKGKKWSVMVPYWREHDIEGERDLVEEVARIYGYHNITPKLPDGDLTATSPDPALLMEDELKRFMEGIGWTETYTYSFTNKDLYTKIGRDVSNLFAISNPLSAEHTHMRDMILPGMLHVVKENQDRFPNAQLFELSNVYLKRDAGLPHEEARYLAVSYGHADEAFSNVKGLWEALATKFGVEGWSLRAPADSDIYALHPGRSAEIVIGGQIVGVLGELHPQILKNFGVDRRAGMLALVMPKLLPSLSFAKKFRGIPEFPSIRRDVSFVVAERTMHAELITAMQAVDERVVAVEKFDEFRGKEIGAEKKSLAYHLEFRSDKKTLETADADAIFAQIITLLKQKFGADVRV